MRKIFYMTSALTLTLFGVPALAGEASAPTAADLARQVEALQHQLLAIQQQLELMKAEDAATRAALAQETASRETAVKAAREANLLAGGKNVIENGTVKMVPPSSAKVAESATHRFAMTSPDGDWSIAPTGRIHFDVGAFLNQKAEGATGPGTAAGGKLSSGVNARRARLGVTGKAMGDFTYTLILDAGGGAGDSTAAINEARFGYTGISNTILEIGYGSQYFTLEEATSSNDIMFIERSTPTTLASNFNAGDPRAAAGFRTWGSNWWLGVYLTGSAPNVAHGLTKRGFGAYERLTYQALQTERASVHVGIGAAQVFQVPNTGPNTASSVTMSDRPENRIDGTVLLNTGPLGTVANPVTGVQVYDFETAATYGNFFYQGEYFRYVVERRGKPKAQFDGAYAQVSYTIGGRRIYVPATGAYSGVNPITPLSPRTGGWGAFEFTGRVSYADLVDHYNSSLAAAAQPFMVNGGRQINYTAGLNWFWNSNMLVKLNYIHTHIDKANPVSAISPTPTGAGLTVDAVIARFQAMF
jgi:phosphate-selective porin OprO/OprP